MKEFIPFLFIHFALKRNKMIYEEEVQKLELSAKRQKIFANSNIEMHVPLQENQIHAAHEYQTPVLSLRHAICGFGLRSGHGFNVVASGKCENGKTWICPPESHMHYILSGHTHSLCKVVKQMCLPYFSSRTVKENQIDKLSTKYNMTWEVANQ